MQLHGKSFKKFLELEFIIEKYFLVVRSNTGKSVCVGRLNTVNTEAHCFS